MARRKKHIEGNTITNADENVAEKKPYNPAEDESFNQAKEFSKVVESATLALAKILLQSAEENCNEINAKLAKAKWWNVRMLRTKAQKAELVKLQAAGILYYAEKMVSNN